MGNLLHERLRKHEDDTPWFVCADGFKADISWKAARHIAEEIDRDYIPREEYEAIIADIFEVGVTKAWAASNGMTFEDGQSFPEWLDKWFIKRPVRDDTRQPLKVDDYDDLLTYSVADDGEWVATFADRQIEGKAEELFHAPVKVLDADGVETYKGDIVFDKFHGSEHTVLEVHEFRQIRISTGDASSAVVDASRVTHTKPVFDADRVRICPGEERWDLKSGIKIAVSRFKKDYDGSDLVCANGDICELEFSPSQLTSKEPDSLEKVRDDINEFIRTYSKHGGNPEITCGKFADRLTAIMERGA